MEQRVNILKRVYIFFFLLAAFGLLLLASAVNIQFFKGDEIVAAVKSTTLKTRTFPAKRGDLYAKDGSLLATSLSYYEVGMDLTSPAIVEDVFKDNVAALADSLSNLLPKKSSRQYYRELNQAYKDSLRWFLIDRSLSYPDFQRLKSFPFLREGRLESGLVYRKYTKRQKPFGVLAARTIGSRAPFGLEGAYDSYLSGENGEQLQKKKSGVWVPVNNGNIKEPVDGSDVYSTIDINIQEVAENALRDQLFHNKADYGCAVVMEVETGKIRAIANLKIDTATGDYWEARNYAVADADEPGSTIKLASFMAILEKKQFNLDEKKVDVGYGVYKVYDRKVRDSHWYKDNTTFTMREVFEKSSNVGTVKLVEQLYKNNPSEFIDRLYAFGLHDKLNIDIRGEATPKIKSPADNDWYGTTLAWTSHGYETQFTPLQTLAFYNAVANKGKLVKPMFIEKIVNDKKQTKLFKPTVIKSSICAQETIGKLQDLLKGVVLRGTAKWPFRGSLYEVAGKTGTAKINYAINGKNKVEYRSSFAGYFPADNPRYSCIVVITNPRENGFYGGSTAAPVFRKISDRIFALDKQLRTDLVPQKEKAAFTSKVTRENELLNVGNVLHLKSDAKGGAELAKASVNGDELKIQSKKISAKNVPDVVGLTAKDALYILEQRGLNVRISGKGKVARQSLLPGSRIIKGGTIEIELD